MSISSNQILAVFPCVSRYTDDANVNMKAKLMSEANITNIIKSITDSKSYIISHSISEGKGTFEFILGGYYFEVTDVSTSGNQYAVLDVGVNDLLSGDDGKGYFKGLSIETTQPSGKPFLQLVSNNNVCTPSYIKFTEDSLRINSIDCGEVSVLK